MTLNKNDKSFITGAVTDGITVALQKVMVPALDSLENGVVEKLEKKIESTRKDLGGRIDSLDRKFNAQQDRLDRHNTKIEALEKIHSKGKHNLDNDLKN